MDLLAVDAAIDSDPAPHIIGVCVRKDGMVREALLGVGLVLERHGVRETRETLALVFVARAEICTLTVRVAVARRSTDHES